MGKRVGPFVGSRCRTGPAWRWPRGSDPGAPWAAKKLRDAVVTKPRLWQRDGDGGPPRPTPARGRVGHRACWTARAPVRGARPPLPFPGHGWLFACASPASALFPRLGAGPRELRALGPRPWDPRGRWRTRPGAGRRFSSGQHGLAQACALPLAMLVLGRNLRGRFLDQNGAEEKMDNGPGHQLLPSPRVAAARGHRPSPVLARPTPSLRPVVATRAQRSAPAARAPGGRRHGLCRPGRSVTRVSPALSAAEAVLGGGRLAGSDPTIAGCPFHCREQLTQAWLLQNSQTPPGGVYPLSPGWVVPSRVPSRPCVWIHPSGLPLSPPLCPHSRLQEVCPSPWWGSQSATCLLCG